MINRAGDGIREGTEQHVTASGAAALNFLNKNTANAVFLENSWLCSVCGSRTNNYMDLIAFGHEIQLFNAKLCVPNLC